MENFVLYHEIMKQEGVIMYKGRKKGTIFYVAVSCIDKKLRVKVTNHVRLIYQLDHEHIAKFMEWYETSNHLWLVTELCVGGSLERMMIEDGPWPEDSIRNFVSQLAYGLHQLHSYGILFVLWQPNKIILDGQRKLKFFDFSDSRKLDEDSDELAKKFFSGLNIEQKEVEELFDYTNPTPYTAPELLNGASPHYSTDIWGLGCVMYQMLTGSVPFSGRDSRELQQSITTNPLIIPKMTKCKSSLKVSWEITDLLERMLCKNPNKRLELEDVFVHPFWNGCLSRLLANDAKNKETSEIAGSRREDVGANSINPPKTPTNNNMEEGDDENTVDDLSFTLHLGAGRQHNATTKATTPGGMEQDDSVRGDVRETTRQVKRNNQFQLQPNGNNNDDSNYAGSRALEQSAGLFDDQNLVEAVLTNNSSTSATKKVIEDYNRMVKDGRLKYEVKQLPLPPHTITKLKSLRLGDREKHLKQLENALRQVERGPPTQRRLNLLNYASHVALATQENSSYLLESSITNSNNSNNTSSQLPPVSLIVDLTRQAKSSPHQELIIRTCQMVAITVYNSFTIPLNIIMELLSLLVELLRDNFRSSRIKYSSTVALCEVLVKLAAGLDRNSVSVSNDEITSIPGLGLAFTLLNRCLQRSEEISLNLVVSKLLDLLSQYNPVRCVITKAALTPETFQQLISVFRFATSDNLRCTAASALARLSRLDPVLLDKLCSSTVAGGSAGSTTVGVTGGSGGAAAGGAIAAGGTGIICSNLLLDNGIHNMPFSVQESVLEMVARLLLQQQTKKRQQKQQNPSPSNRDGSSDQYLMGFLNIFSRLLDCPSSDIRARVLMVLFLLSRFDMRNLRAIFNDTKLLAHLDREIRRTSQNQYLDDSNCQALNNILSAWVHFLVMIAVPAILSDSLDALDAVKGRKHPSSTQTRALKSTLPLLEVAAAIVTSSGLRSSVLSIIYVQNQSKEAEEANQQLFSQLGRLLEYAQDIDVGNTCIDFGGTNNNSSAFMMHVLSLLEGLNRNQNGGTVTGDNTQLVRYILLPLANLTISTQNPDTRIIALKLCGDVVLNLSSSLSQDDEDNMSIQPGNVVTAAIPSNQNAGLLSDNNYKAALECVSQAVEDCLMANAIQFVQDRDPSPAHLVRIVRQYLVLSPESCVAAMRKFSFSELLVQLLLDHQHRVMAGAVSESLWLISAVSQVNIEFLHDSLLELDLLSVLRDIFLEIGSHYCRNTIGNYSNSTSGTGRTTRNGGGGSANSGKVVEMMQLAIDSLFLVARLISDVVRRALQCRKDSTVDADLVSQLTEEAEELLGVGRPLTESVGLLCQLIGGNCKTGPTTNTTGGGGGGGGGYNYANSEVPEVVDAAVRLLNQVVSLYGGQQIQHGLHPNNIGCLCAATVVGGVVTEHHSKSPLHKHRRTILRIIKRLLASSKAGSETETIVSEMLTSFRQQQQIDKDNVSIGLLEEINKLITH